VNDIKAIIKEILPNVKFATWGSYVSLPENDLDEKQFKDQLRGACLVQYQPASVPV
jgi:hypothetical protein